MDFVADTDRNPFGMNPPCERLVPGYGDSGANFHVVGDSPAIHGGLDDGIPFTGQPWSDDFFDALTRAGLVEDVDPSADTLEANGTYLSYLHMCDSEGPPTDADYAALEPYFDAELRAITAHVLLPVGERAFEHVLDNFTARSTDTLDAGAVHATEIRGSGWLVVPVKEPAEWADEDADALVEVLVGLQRGDYRRTADLGRFLPDEESYLVR